MMDLREMRKKAPLFPAIFLRRGVVTLRQECCHPNERPKCSATVQSASEIDWRHYLFLMARLTTGATVSTDMRLSMVMMVRVNQAVALFLGLAG